MDEIESIEKQINNTKKSLFLTEERISEYPEPTSVPLKYIKNKRKLETRLKELRAKLIGLNKNRDRLKERRDIPPLLPYFVNRSSQQIELKEALKKLFNHPYSQPLLCIIHGDKLQCHDTFFQFLEKEFLPKIFKENTNINTNNNYTEFIKEYQLKWPPRNTSIEDLKNRLEHNLVDTVLDNKFASKADINEYLASIGTVIIHTHLLTADLQENSSIIIEKFIEFWQDWPELIPNQHLIIFLFIKYKIEPKQNYFQKLQNWIFQNLFKNNSNTRTGNYSIQKSIKDLSSSNFTKFDKIIGVVLPELQGITQTEVEDWARREEVKNYWDEENIQDLINIIEDMFEKWEKQQASDTMPMSNLAIKLTDILMGKIPIKEDTA